MDIEQPTCPTSKLDLQGQYDELVEFLEYEESYTVDPKSQKRIRAKLKELGIWQTD